MQLAPSMPHALTRLLEMLDPERMLDATKTLCSATFAGRRVGTEGHQRATRFLAEQFRQAGWPAHSEAFALATPVLDASAPLQLELLRDDGTRERSLSRRIEFCEHPRSASHPEAIEGKAVHLSTAASLQQSWVMVESVPQGGEFNALAAQLAQRGAIGILAPLYAQTSGYLTRRIMAGSPVALPVLSVRADLLPTLEGRRLCARVPVVVRQAQGYNVLAQREGRDEQWSKMPLLIGAHYDGVGDDVGGPRLPGATDNAAAVSVLLEVARVLAQSPVPPQRPLHLVAFDAEEVGAQGSRWAAARYQEQGMTPLLLNLDGAACLMEAVCVEGGSLTEPVMQALDQAGEWLEIPLVLGNVASDQRSFAAAGFPAVGLSVGAADLHTPADTIERVEPAALWRAAALLCGAIWQLAWVS